MSGLYTVDLDELLATVEDLRRCGTALDQRLADVSARVDALHGTWHGRAALAQQAAQAEWETGFREMRDGLAAMRRAGAVAHDQYEAAAGTNLRMWEQVS